MISEEIKAAQTTYLARPFVVRWDDSHFATTNRFETFDEAFDYVQYMWALIRKEVNNHPLRASNLRCSYLETPYGGRVSLRYVLLCDDVSSY